MENKIETTIIKMDGNYRLDHNMDGGKARGLIKMNPDELDSIIKSFKIFVAKALENAGIFIDRKKM